MSFGFEESHERQQFFAAKAEQAEEKARQCKDPMVRESWISIASSWRLLAENSGNIPKPRRAAPGKFTV
jgi:hypothetical protein